MTDHTWTARSRHLTSEGVTVYEACRCGAQRVRLQAWTDPQVAVGPAARRSPRPAR